MCCVEVGAMGNDDEEGSALETTAARGGRVRASGPALPPPVCGRLVVDPSPETKLNVLEKARKDCECVDDEEEGARKDWLWSRKE